MELTGPEPKRQRLDYNGQPQRMPPQPPPPPQSHNHPSTLPPPHSYPPPQQPPPPPSPYDVGPHDPRNLPDPTGPHAYVQEHSGHSTPIRDQRFHPEPNYSRRSSLSVARSPDGHHQYQSARPMSVATTAEGQPYPPQYPIVSDGQPGYAAHDATSNGHVNHGLPTHPYDQTHAYAPAHPGDYGHSPVTAGHPYGPPMTPYGVAFNQGNARPIRKGNRAQQACDVCRTRKAKCDEGRPECGFCTENGMKCNYQNVAPAKADRANQQIIDQLQSHKEEIKALKEGWGGRFDKIENMLQQISAGQGVTQGKQEPKPPSLKLEDSQMESPPNRAAGAMKAAPFNDVGRNLGKDQSGSSGGPGASVNNPIATVNASDTTVNSSGATVNNSGTTGNDLCAATNAGGNESFTSQTNAIYIEHDTAAQKLFRWRSIKNLLRRSKELQFSDRTEEYVMDFETNKGILRLYGKGRQTRDVGDGSQTGGSVSSPADSANSGPSDESSAGSSPAASPECLWGTGLLPATTDPRSTNDTGGLNPDSTLKLDTKTMNRLLKSYLSNLQILHPFLDEPKLTRQIDHFSRRHNSQDPSSARPSYLVSGPVDLLRENQVAKRKHSEGPYYMAMEHSSVASSPTTVNTQIERSPETALILLVMALGRICESRDDLPGPVSDGLKEPVHHPANTYSPLARQVDSPPPSYPMRHSPSTSSHSTVNTSAPSPLNRGRFGLSSPRSSISEVLPGTRNIDVIPGLAYYAQASDILGNLTGCQDLVMAQCCLLAGLFAGQLANTLESLTWIQTASRICRLLVKQPSFKRVMKTSKHNFITSKHNFISLAFWTSLQLESDILAELDIPPSGIQEVQNDVPYPKGTTDLIGGGSVEAVAPDIMTYYSSQLYMRNLLNDIQKELYQEKDPTFKRATRSTSLRNAFNESLSVWRNGLPHGLQWDDDGPEANNINDARLRGKYYGAQYIIHRPFLHAALDYDFEAPSSKSPHSDSLSTSQTARLASTQKMGPPQRTSDDYIKRRNEIIKLAVECIDAAKHSTVAFDGVLDHRRLVVTNIMGTAHAQFGNMLVLSAAYKSKTLGSYVQANHLERLFNRTIKLLKALSPISRTLEKDCQILKCLKDVVFEDNDPEMRTSFSSSDM